MKNLAATSGPVERRDDGRTRIATVGVATFGDSFAAALWLALLLVARIFTRTGANAFATTHIVTNRQNKHPFSGI